eukprot:PITA_32243
MPMFLRIEYRLDWISNYVVWKDRIQTMFEEAAVWDIVRQVVVPPAADELVEFTKNNAKEKRILMDSLKHHVVPQVRGNTYAYQTWTTITTLYQGTNESRKMVLKEQLKNIRMTKAKSVGHYLGRVKQVRDDLTTIGETVAPTELVRIAIAGLPKSWEVFGDVVTSRENLPNWDRFWDDYVWHEIQKTGSGGLKIVDEEYVALTARGKNKGKAMKGSSSDGAKGKEKKKKQNMDMSKVKCWACQKMGHYVATCPKRKNKGRKGITTSAGVEQFASQFNQDFAFITSTSSRSTSFDVWYIHSGASRHMTGAREFFSELAERAIDIEIVLGDDRTIRVVGVGTMTFERESLPPLKIMDVLYVPGMKKNLISVSAMEEKGFDVTFSGGQVLMHPRGASITSAKVIGDRSRKLYRFSFQSARALLSCTSGSTHTSTTSNRDLCELWHRKMAHMHHGALRVLREITTEVLDFSVEHYEVCRGCALGGYEYYVIFIDDYSRRTWIYFLKTKCKVFNHFKEFNALVEKKIGRNIRVLRSDNRGEYTNGGFSNFCAQEGIKRELTVPYNPQQNGVSERKNRAIVGVATAMIHDQGLPLFLWTEAYNTVVYLQNKSPHRVLGNMTPEEAFTGEKPHVGHLRIFGCLTYSYIPKEQRTKLEPMAEKGILMAYSETSKAYRIFIPFKWRVVIRRDVKFEEERAYQRSQEL